MGLKKASVRSSSGFLMCVCFFGLQAGLCQVTGPRKGILAKTLYFPFFSNKSPPLAVLLLSKVGTAYEYLFRNWTSFPASLQTRNQSWVTFKVKPILTYIYLCTFSASTQCYQAMPGECIWRFKLAAWPYPSYCLLVKVSVSNAGSISNLTRQARATHMFLARNTGPAELCFERRLRDSKAAKDLAVACGNLTNLTSSLSCFLATTIAQMQS